ncbi:MAG: hypothetical protein N2749_03260 [Clostridia bacterium]|nr:hypothetical protein [Clostridia bacterium]
MEKISSMIVWVGYKKGIENFMKNTASNCFPVEFFELICYAFSDAHNHITPLEFYMKLKCTICDIKTGVIFDKFNDQNPDFIHEVKKNLLMDSEELAIKLLERIAPPKFLEMSKSLFLSCNKRSVNPL